MSLNHQQKESQYDPRPHISVEVRSEKMLFRPGCI